MSYHVKATLCHDIMTYDTVYVVAALNLHTTVILYCSVHQSIMISDLDRSKPYVPVLDSSSQLMEDSFIVGEKRTEIHVTPLAKKKRVGKTRKRKRDIEMEKVDSKVSGQTY